MKDLKVTIIILLSALFSALVNGEDLMSDDGLMGNNTIKTILLNISQYCFVDDNIIRLNVNTTTLLNITDINEDIIIATATAAENTDTTVIFIAPVNGSRCTSDDSDHNSRPSTLLYVIQMIAYSLTALTAIGNIMLHLLVKGLHTVSGILVTILSVSVVVTNLIAAGALTNTFVNEVTLICVVLINIVFVILLVYQATKLALLYHFAYLMYKSYRLKSNKESTKNILFKYITFIVISSSLCYMLAVAIDVAISGTINDDMERYCFSSDFTFTRMMLVYGELGIFLILEYVVFAVGLTLYFLVSKNCCAMKSTNFRVTMVLTATLGISLVLLFSLKKASIPVKILIPAITTSTLIEQIILLTLFLTSNKVISTCRSAYRKSTSMQGVIQKADMIEQV